MRTARFTIDVEVPDNVSDDSLETAARLLAEDLPEDAEYEGEVGTRHFAIKFALPGQPDKHKTVKEGETFDPKSYIISIDGTHLEK